MMSTGARDEIALVIVAAIGRNGAIGRDNALPWRMPGDLAHFRRCTMGKPMIMGRLTFAAIGRALPGRETIVVTRSGKAALPPGVLRADSPDAALALGRERAAAVGTGDVILAGGGVLFATMIDKVDRLRMTYVDLAPAADVFFPPIDPAAWDEESRVVPPRHPADEAACCFVDYRRRAGT